MGYILGIDVGGTNTRLGLVSESGELTEFVREATSQYNTEGKAVTLFMELVKKYISEHAKGKAIDAISVGFPSTVDKDRKVVIETPNIAGLNNIPVVDTFEKEFGVPVFLERDTCLILINDMEKNRIPAEGVAIGIYYGTGIGNAISIDGRIFTGKHGVSAELGHIPMRGVEGRCGCGNSSCAEVVACGRALEGIMERHFPGEDISKVFTEHGDSEVIRRFVDDLSIPAATEINILDPDYIIIGGGLPNMEGFPREELESHIHRYARKPLPDEDLRFIYSKEGQESGVMGAAIHARQELLKREKAER